MLPQIRFAILLIVLGSVGSDVWSADPMPATPMPRIDAFGDPLPESVIARYGNLRWQAPGPIVGVQFCNGDKQLVTVSRDGEIVTWDTDRGVVLRQVSRNRLPRLVPSSGGEVKFLADVTPDGKVAAMATNDGRLAAWNLTDSTLNFFQPVPSGKIAALRLSLNGKSIFVMSSDYSLLEIDAGDGKLLRKIHQSAPPGIRPAQNVDGPLLALLLHEDVLCSPIPASKTMDGFQIRQFDLKTGKAMPAFDGPKGATQVVVAANLKRAAFTDDKKDIVIWDLSTDREVGRLTNAVPPGNNFLQFSPDVARLAVRHQDQTISIWDLESRKVQRIIERTESKYSNRTFLSTCKAAQAGFAFSQDSKRLAVSTLGNSLRQWDVLTGDELACSAIHAGPVGFVQLTQDGGALVTNASDNTIRWWETATGKLTRTWQLPTKTEEVVSTADGRTLFTCDQSGLIQQWNATDGKAEGSWKISLVGDLTRPGDWYDFRMAISPDGKRLVSDVRNPRTSSRRIALHSIEGKSETKILSDEPYRSDGLTSGDTTGGARYYCPAVFSPDGTVLAAVLLRDKGQNRNKEKEPRILRIWDVARQSPVTEFELPATETPMAVAICPGNRMAAIGNYESKELTLWEIASGGVRHSAQLRNNTAFCQFVRGGKELLVIGAGVSSAQRIHLYQDAPPQTYWGHKSWIVSLSVAADGATIATGGYDHTAPTYALGVAAPPAQEPKELSAEQAAALCTHLSGNDAKKAFLAIRRLIQSPEPSLAMFRQNATILAPQESPRVAVLIRQLDAENFEEREKATQELKEIGIDAVPALREALKGEVSLEMKTRITAVLRDQAPGIPPQYLQIRRALEVMELIGTPAAKQVLEEWGAKTMDREFATEIQQVLARLSRSP